MTQAFCPHCGYDLLPAEGIRVGLYTMHTPYGDLIAGDKVLRFTTSETAIIYSLLLASPEPVSTTVLRERLGTEADGNVLQVFISRIRRRLMEAGLADPIQTVRGRGYAWLPGTTQGEP